MRKKALSFLLSYIRKFIPLFILSLILGTVSVAGTLIFPILTGRIIDIIAGEIPTDNVFEAVFEYLRLGGIVVLIAAIATFVMNIINNRCAINIVDLMRKDAMAKIQRLPISYVDSHSRGDVVSRVISDVDTVSDGLFMGFSQLFTGILTIVGTLGLMISISWRIAVVVVCVTPLSFFVASFITKRTYNLFKKRAEKKGEVTGFIDEYVSGQKIVRAFGKEADASDSFRQINDELGKVGLKAVFYSSLTNPSTRFVNALCYAGVAVFGAMAITGNAEFRVGELTCFLSYATSYTKPFNEISGVITELSNALACAYRIREFLNDTEMEELPPANIDLEGNIQIQNVSFSYDKKTSLITNFNLEAHKGQRIAIVGPTGCGKTTLINLLMRFYDIDEGKILLDGTDIMTMNRTSMRKNYGMVLQDTYLRTASVRDNIAMGKEDATLEEITEAAKKAHAHRFIEKLPNGYDTIIGENDNLSAGQKQLLCIARVMMTDPAILILDEATSSIDTRTERKVQDAFLTLTEGRTSFIVAHRLQTIRNADLILVMKDGNIIEQGTHEELIAKGGFYNELYTSQYS